MKKIKKAFTLIEVIIATGIITIAVFGIYKLISENTKIISNSSNYLQTISLFPVLENCIENIGIDDFLSSSTVLYDFNFGSNPTIDECYTGVTVDSVILDNIEYTLIGEITGSGTNYIDWELSIGSDSINNSTGFYKQIKK